LKDGIPAQVEAGDAHLVSGALRLGRLGLVGHLLLPRLRLQGHALRLPLRLECRLELCLKRLAPLLPFRLGRRQLPPCLRPRLRARAISDASALVHQLPHLLSQRKDHFLQLCSRPLPLLLHLHPSVQLLLVGSQLLELLSAFFLAFHPRLAALLGRSNLLAQPLQVRLDQPLHLGRPRHPHGVIVCHNDARLLRQL
jgi:hypothetical protein